MDTRIDLAGAPEVARIIVEVSDKQVSSDARFPTEMRARLLYPMINEGAKILEEGLATRASNIDVIWVYGYSWPSAVPARHTGPIRLVSRRSATACSSSSGAPATIALGRRRCSASSRSGQGFLDK